MTPENQKLRESLKAAENIIVSALAHQPENDDACRNHLLQAKMDVEKAINHDAKPLRVCDVNTLESLSDFVVKTVLDSGYLKDVLAGFRGLVEASIRASLKIAYEPANLNNKENS